MGKAERTKGHNFERQVARAMQAVFPNAKRGYQTRGGGKEECDVEGTPFHVECKVGARPNINGAVKQAEEDTEGRPILVITKKDREEPLATMHVTTFLSLFSQLQMIDRLPVKRFSELFKKSE